MKIRRKKERKKRKESKKERKKGGLIKSKGKIRQREERLWSRATSKKIIDIDEKERKL